MVSFVFFIGHIFASGMTMFSTSVRVVLWELLQGCYVLPASHDFEGVRCQSERSRAVRSDIQVHLVLSKDFVLVQVSRDLLKDNTNVITVTTSGRKHSLPE